MEASSSVWPTLYNINIIDNENDLLRKKLSALVLPLLSYVYTTGIKMHFNATQYRYTVSQKVDHKLMATTLSKSNQFLKLNQH